MLADGEIGHGEAELGQFGLDALAAPSRIAGPHLTDDRDQFAIERGSAASRTEFPAPEQPEAQPMAAYQGSRLEDQKHPLPIGLATPQQHPEQAIGTAKDGPWGRAFKHRKLMPQGKVLQQKVPARL